MTLKREFDGEIIKAVVNMRYIKYWEQTWDRDQYDPSFEETIQPYIKMVITVV